MCKLIFHIASARQSYLTRKIRRTQVSCYTTHRCYAHLVVDQRLQLSCNTTHRPRADIEQVRRPHRSVTSQSNSVRQSRSKRGKQSYRNLLRCGHPNLNDCACCLCSVAPCSKYLQQNSWFFNKRCQNGIDESSRDEGPSLYWPTLHKSQQGKSA